jgi:2'-5' RNA ligase
VTTHPTEFTTLLVPMYEVGRQIDDLRSLDPAAGFGLPAHVTVSYPFGPLDELDSSVISRLRALFAAQQPFAVEFRTTRWFGDDVLWLAPDDPRPFVAMTEAVRAAYPEWQPYGGAFATVVPHLTVGDNTESAGRVASASQLRAAEVAVLARLPLRDSAERVVLMAGKREPNSWRVLEEFRLGRRTDEMIGREPFADEAAANRGRPGR